jgi:hypothetical protein
MRAGHTSKTTLVVATLLSSALSVCSAFAERSSDGITIALIDKPWAISLNLTGYRIHVNGVTPDGRRYVLATDARTATTLSVTLEKVRGQATRQGCRAHLRQAAKASAAGQHGNMREYDSRHMSVIEYLQPGTEGPSAGQFHLLACSGRDNVYADFHLSKKDFRAGDESLLHDLLSTVEVVQAAAPESLDHFRAGSAPFLRGHYALAVSHYEEALALEQSHPTLDHAIWRLLVHNLATSYRMMGDVPRAMRILEYGLSKDPAYPLFHYNLARLHARMNDRNHAMESLHAAFNSPGAKDSALLPDPRQDDCFKRVMLDPSFRALVDSLMQPAI